MIWILAVPVFVILLYIIVFHVFGIVTPDRDDEDFTE